MLAVRSLVSSITLPLLAAVLVLAGCDPQRAPPDRLRAAPLERVAIAHGLLDPVIGESAAPVEVVVFGNPHCRACDAALERLFAMQAERPEVLRVVYKWVGEPDDVDELRPATAIYAAGALGCFRAFHEAQERTRPRTTAELELAAETAGCGGDAFRAAMTSAEVAEAVRASAREGRALGIRTTPLIVINGRVITGKLPAHALATVIDAELRGAALERRPERAAINPRRVR